MDFEDHDKVQPVGNYQDKVVNHIPNTVYIYIYKNTKLQNIHSHWIPISISTNFWINCTAWPPSMASSNVDPSLCSSEVLMFGSRTRFNKNIRLAAFEPLILWRSKKRMVWERSIAEQGWVWSLGAVWGKRKHHFLGWRKGTTEARFWLYKIVLMHPRHQLWIFKGCGAGRHVNFLQQANYAIKLERTIKSRQIDIHAVDINIIYTRRHFSKLPTCFHTITQLLFQLLPSVSIWPSSFRFPVDRCCRCRFKCLGGSGVRIMAWKHCSNCGHNFRGEVKGWEFLR